ncbi:MAG: class I SAM-dependent methyltransferase [Pirellulaceae bacterium]|nr:class I SAM-dependent methyltransferase [Pirellulaceae bacterium]
MNDPRIAFFDRIAANWDHSGQNPLETIDRLGQLDEHLRLTPGLDVLEVGCGTGQITGWLAGVVAPGRVVAIDFSEAMLAQARAKRIDAEFRRCDVCADRLPPRMVDLVLCFHSFPHFRDQDAAMRNLAGALRPGGRLLVVHLASIAAINAFHDGVGGEVAGDHLPDEQEWSRLLAAVGLRQTTWIDREGLFVIEGVLDDKE